MKLHFGAAQGQSWLRMLQVLWLLQVVKQLSLKTPSRTLDNQEVVKKTRYNLYYLYIR